MPSRKCVEAAGTPRLDARAASRNAGWLLLAALHRGKRRSCHDGPLRYRSIPSQATASPFRTIDYWFSLVRHTKFETSDGRFDRTEQEGHRVTSEVAPQSAERTRLLAQVIGLSVACPMSQDNPEGCQLCTVRMGSFPQRVEWANGLTDDELRHLVSRHLACGRNGGS